MTIEELRSAMRRKVVPEEVVPQNVISCLIDEDAEPPKPDAFTFLMRLRALGIGSTDFVNLLEGCGAPDGVVAKIKQNPAMNLQGLILTLENSELDSDDYTRMLLTARQVWERTLTLRLEKSETLSHIIDEYEKEDAPEEPEISDEQEKSEKIDEEYEEEFDPEYDEDMREMSFTAVFEKISAEIKAGKITPSEPDPDDASDEAPEEIAGKAPVKPEPEREPETEDNIADLSFTAAFDKIKAEKKLAFAEDLAEKTEEQSRTLENTLDNIIETSPEKTEEKIEEILEEKTEPEPIKEPEPEPEPEPIKKPAKNPFAEEIVKTARQKERNRILEEIRQEEEDEIEEDEEEFDDEYEDEEYDDEEYDDEYDEDDEDEDGDYDEEDERRSSRKGAIIWAASGAAILICAGAIIGVMVGKNSGGKSKSLDYAKNNSEIFEKIAAAYGAEIPGGESPSELGTDYSTLFGDLLISGESGSSLGSYTLGTEVYSVAEGAVSANIVENGAMRSLADITPPDKARFVAAFDEGGKLYALFSGRQSGYVKISGGKAEYTVKQDGVLTDYEFADGEMKLGTVYTPVFTETFMIEDENVYLPKTGTAELAVIPAESIIMTDTTGYSYGVSAAYSSENGERKTACAVIGNPVAASADGRFALNSDEDGLLVNTNGKKPETRTTEKLIRAAFCKDGGAILEEKISIGAGENSDSNSGAENSAGANTVTLLNGELKPASILSGVPEKITGMWFDGAILTINGEGSSILRVDCAELDKPNPLTLKTAVGVTAEHSALTFETYGGTLVITRYDLENGKVVKLCEYTKELPSEQLATLKLGDPKTAVISGGTSGIAYSYFDGVSVVSEYVVFASGQAPKTETLFDDSKGFTAAFANGGRISAVCGEGVKTL